jgi:flagella basal body P-ring formation protein FlgA
MIRSSLWLLARSALLLVTAAMRVTAQPADVPPHAAANAPSAALVADLAREITDHFHLTGELQLDPVRVWGLPALPDGTPARLVVTEFPSALSSSMLLRCQLETGSAPLPPWSISVHAQLWADAWTTREPLETGALFDPARLEVHRCDMLHEHDALPATVNDRDYMLARSVPAGRALVWRDIVRRPLVRKGETIEVSAVDGSLTVTIKALAIQNGGRGDLVLVRNLESKKEFTAVVVDENHVQVRF